MMHHKALCGILVVVAAIIAGCGSKPEEWYYGSWTMDDEWLAEQAAANTEDQLLKFTRIMEGKITYSFAPDHLSLTKGEQHTESAAAFELDEAGWVVIRPLKDGEPTKYPPIAIRQVEGRAFMEARLPKKELHVDSVDIPLLRVD